MCVFLCIAAVNFYFHKSAVLELDISKGKESLNTQELSNIDPEKFKNQVNNWFESTCLCISKEFWEAERWTLSAKVCDIVLVCNIS